MLASCGTCHSEQEIAELMPLPPSSDWTEYEYVVGYLAPIGKANDRDRVKFDLPPESTSHHPHPQRHTGKDCFCAKRGRMDRDINAARGRAGKQGYVD